MPERLPTGPRFHPGARPGGRRAWHIMLHHATPFGGRSYMQLKTAQPARADWKWRCVVLAVALACGCSGEPGGSPDTQATPAPLEQELSQATGSMRLGRWDHTATRLRD